MCALVLIVLSLLVIGGIKMALNFDALSARVDSFVSLVAGIRADYESLKARIEDLEGQIDPEAQAKIDAAVAALDARFDEFAELDNSVPGGTSTDTGTDTGTEPPVG